MKKYISARETRWELESMTRWCLTKPGLIWSLREDCHRHLYPRWHRLPSHDRLYSNFFMGGEQVAKHQRKSFYSVWHTWLVISDNWTQFTSDRRLRENVGLLTAYISVALEIATAMAKPIQEWRQPKESWRNQRRLERTHTSPYSATETRTHKEWQPGCTTSDKPRNHTLPPTTQGLLLPRPINLES